MKFMAALILSLSLLTGCSSKDTSIEQAMDLRKAVLEAQTCSFRAIVTADYEDSLYTFQINCTADQNGSLSFTVADPQSISGIGGTISKETAVLSFDDTILALPMLADGELTPVSAPWIFLNTLRSGYLTGCSREYDGICMYIDDSYEENPLHLEIRTDADMVPIYAEILWKGRRILSIDIQDFTLV